MADELKACPFCGVAVTVLRDKRHPMSDQELYCSGCKCRFWWPELKFTPGKVSQQVRDTFNTRALQPSAIRAARLEGVEAAMKCALRAIEDEPNLPGPMPNGFQETFERVPLDVSLRILVALTKSGIRDRIEAALAKPKEEV